jgi:SAM-dependent MidA family methyltransferase
MPISGNPSLIARISAEISASPTGAIPFATFMRLALYDPDFGYYAAGSEQRVGRGGDFYTSVSVGEIFGQLLAQHFLEAQPDLGQIVEQGANDGQLACDLLRHLPAELDYIIIEPYPALRAVQQEKIGRRVRWVDSISQIEAGITGRFLCNELLDALPVQRVRIESGRWKEIHLSEDFEEHLLPPSSPELEREIESVLQPRDLPDGYTTELHLEANAWTRELVGHLQPGSRATIIDYGHEADDYYAPQRDDGTLRGYRNHQQVTRVLEHIGETDLTASLNFTRIAELAGAAGAIDQHHFLIGAAKPWLAAIEATGEAPDAATQKHLRQFQTLIHPAMMGQSFKVLDFGI